MARTAAAPAGPAAALRVSQRDELGPDAFCLSLVPARRRRPLRPFQPGQHVVLHVPANGARDLRRAYSLAAWNERPGAYAIAVKREAEGTVSRWLFEHARPGRKLRAGEPKGAFHRGLADDAGDVALIAGGIGITPMRAMLQPWDASPKPPRVTLHFSARTRDQLYFHDEFERLAPARPWFDYRPRLTQPPTDWDGESGRLTADAVLASVADPAAATVFLCANQAMDDALVGGLTGAGMDRRRIHREAFGVQAERNQIQAEIAFRGRRFGYDGAPTLLHALTGQGFDIPAECRAGECGACRLSIVRGRALDLISGRESDSTALACCAVPAGDLELRD